MVQWTCLSRDQGDRHARSILQPAVFIRHFIVFFANHFAVKFPESGQHFFLLGFVEVFL